MKKILILVLSISLFTACSEDDASIEGNIVGTWLLVEANNIPGYTVDECTGQSTITFNADNTASSTFYSETEAGCVSDSDSGNWSNSSGSQYTIKVPQLGDVQGTVIFSNENRFTFTPNDLPTSSLTFERN